MKRQHQNSPSPFPDRMLSEATELGFSFLCVYFVLLYVSFDWWICAFVVLGLVFPYQAKTGLGNVSKMTYFVLSGT